MIFLWYHYIFGWYNVWYKGSIGYYGLLSYNFLKNSFLVHVLLIFPFGNITVVSEHNIGSTYEFQPIFYKKKKRMIRDLKWWKEWTLSHHFSDLWRTSLRRLSKWKRRCNETFRGFQEEEGPCTSYSQKKEPMLKQAPKNYTSPFPFEEEEKRHGDGGHLENEILSGYLAEYKSQPRAFKETLPFP